MLQTSYFVYIWALIDRNGSTNITNTTFSFTSI